MTDALRFLWSETTFLGPRSEPRDPDDTIARVRSEHVRGRRPPRHARVGRAVRGTPAAYEQGRPPSAASRVARAALARERRQFGAASTSPGRLPTQEARRATGYARIGDHGSKVGRRGRLPALSR